MEDQVQGTAGERGDPCFLPSHPSHPGHSVCISIHLCICVFVSIFVFVFVKGGSLLLILGLTAISLSIEQAWVTLGAAVNFEDRQDGSF